MFSSSLIKSVAVSVVRVCEVSFVVVLGISGQGDEAKTE